MAKLTGAESVAAWPGPRFAPKVPVGWIVQLYRRNALGIHDAELMDQVGGRVYARCLDVMAAPSQEERGFATETS